MVEQWLVDVEKNMYRSMARVIDEGLEKYKSMDRPTWCLQEAGQTVITVTQMCWTADVDEALQKAAGGEKDALGKYHEQLVSDLNGIVEKVRGKLSKIERKVMGPLIVMDVHSRRDRRHGEEECGGAHRLRLARADALLRARAASASR